MIKQVKERKPTKEIHFKMQMSLEISSYIILENEKNTGQVLI